MLLVHRELKDNAQAENYFNDQNYESNAIFKNNQCVGRSRKATITLHLQHMHNATYIFFELFGNDELLIRKYI